MQDGALAEVKLSKTSASPQLTVAACIVVADFVTTKFHLKTKYNAKRKYD